MSNPKPAPQCGRCQQYAADMEALDAYWAESPDEVYALELDEIQRRRVEYVRHGDGSYNKSNGRFWCDPCYVAIGAPLGVCP